MTNHDDRHLEKSDSPSPDDALPIGHRIVLWLIHGSVYLFAIALVGIAGSSASLMGSFDYGVRKWGWVAGALLAAVGYPLGWVKFLGVKHHQMSQAEHEADSRPPRRAMGSVSGCFAGIFAGVLLGIPAGLSG